MAVFEIDGDLKDHVGDIAVIKAVAVGAGAENQFFLGVAVCRSVVALNALRDRAGVIGEDIIKAVSVVHAAEH